MSDKSLALFGDKMVDFPKELMLQNSVKALKEVIRNLIPPKGVKWKVNFEGSELLDCEGEEISLKGFQQECDEFQSTTLVFRIWPMILTSKNNQIFR